MTATKVGRLAQRREGGFWNAYWVPQQHTMDGALLVGSIRLSTVKGRVREDFIALMRAAFDTVAEDVLATAASRSSRCAPTFLSGSPRPGRERGSSACARRSIASSPARRLTTGSMTPWPKASTRCEFLGALGICKLNLHK